jgi:hypothetical protein
MLLSRYATLRLRYCNCRLSTVRAFADVNPITAADKPSFPRLVIPRNLPKQSAGNQSPAKLWLYCKSNQITLDGAFDGTLNVMILATY